MKILVVDDDAVARMMLARTVSQLGHECYEAEGGEHAWRAYLRLCPDVIITDRVMPGVDGLELCRRIRSDARRAYSFIILVTTRNGHDEVLAGVRAGADDYLVKPLEAFDLEVRLVTAERVTTLHRELAGATRRLRELNTTLAETCRSDGLTGVGNRRRFDEDLTRIHASSSRRKESYTVAFFDVDFFKSYNDRHGHLAGDRALRTVAVALGRACRASDLVYRYGGEEFAVIYTGAGFPEVLLAVERARAGVEAARVDPDGEALAAPVTISAGVAEGRWDGPAARAVAAADAALYVAKGLGRNRVAAEPRGPSADCGEAPSPASLAHPGGSWTKSRVEPTGVVSDVS